MSSWTYINGVVVVEPFGRTQAEKRYILDTVLEHLPQVTGSERGMNIHVIQRSNFDTSSSQDEFGKFTNNLKDDFGYKSRKRGLLRTQSEYILVVEGNLRDRKFTDTYKEFQNWICRLAKRILIKDVLVEVGCWDKNSIITNPILHNKKYFETSYGQMFEEPSWVRRNRSKEINWCEYLMWKPMNNRRYLDYPAILGYKYFNVPENDKKVEKWLNINS